MHQSHEHQARALRGTRFDPLPLAVLLLCAGFTGELPASDRKPESSPIDGRYDVEVALKENDCGAVTVLPQPTSVRHKVGAERFTLRHGSLTFRAALGADNTFVAEPLSLSGSDGVTLVVLLQGRFDGTMLAATVAVEERRRRSCRYQVQWSGRKVGS